MAKFRAIVNAVRQAITGDATTADVLSGKTFMSSASPNEQTGAMTNNGAVTASLTASGQEYTIPAGYHNGAGKVTASFNWYNPTPLWTNSDPTTSFAGQTISINLTDYSGVIIEFNTDTSRQTLSGRAYAKKSDNIQSQQFGAGMNNGTNGFARNIASITNSGLYISDCHQGDNQGMIPTVIYGVY